MSSVINRSEYTRVFMTPEMASEILETRNKRNRTISKELVNRISRAIKNDQWIYNGQPIIFDNNGLLIDGQHRLTAIAKSGAAVELLLVNDVNDKKAFRTIDECKPRSFSCNLSADDVSNSTAVAAVSKLFYAIYRCKDLSQFKLYTHAFSNIELFEFLEQVPFIHEAAKMAGKSREFCTVSLMGAALTVFMLIDESKAREFHYIFCEEEYPYRDHPIKRLKGKLIKGNMRTGKKLKKLEKLALIFKAWSYWQQGRVVKNLSWNEKGEFPVPLGWS